MEEDIRGTIRLIDAPLIGYSIHKNTGYNISHPVSSRLLSPHILTIRYQALCDYSLEQQMAHLGHELYPQRSSTLYVDNRIHLCLYFISPCQDQLSNIDICHLQKISSITNVLLVSCKADMLTGEEMLALETSVLEHCRQNQIHLFDEKLHKASNRSNSTDTLVGVLMSVNYFPELVHLAQTKHYEVFRRQQLKGHKVRPSSRPLTAHMDALTL